MKSGTIHASSPGPSFSAESRLKSVSRLLKFDMYRKCAPIDGRELITNVRGSSGLQRSDSVLNATVKSLPVERYWLVASFSVPTTGMLTSYTSIVIVA